MTKVALEQLAVTPGRVDDNREHAGVRATESLRAGADIVVLPELTISGYVTEPRAANAAAEQFDGPSVDLFTRITSSCGGLVAFGFCERDGQDLFNTVVVVGADGPIMRYRKIHLFDCEPDAFTPGNLGLPVAGTPFGNIGVCICYDLRFVEVLRILSLQGADIVLAPAAWVAGFDRPMQNSSATRHVDSVLAQANLDQVAVVAVSQVAGSAPGSPATLGGSIACDAYGELVAGPLSREAPASAVVSFDVAAIRAAQVRGSTIRPRADRRVDVYSVAYDGRWL